MRKLAEIQLLETPIECAVEDVEGVHLTPFLITGIVNPFGPTLTFLASVGEGPARAVVQGWLNPFSHHIARIGTFFTGERWSPQQEFQKLLPYLGGSCPTIVLVSAMLDAEDRVAVVEDALSSFEDVEDVIDEVRRFFGNPTDRVSRALGAEIQAPEISPEAASAAESQLLLDPRHLWPELRAFFFAWNGSIHRTRITSAMKDTAFPLERMKAIFDSKVESVWLPEEEPNASKAPPPLPERPLQAPQSAAEMRDQLASRDYWQTFAGDQLLQFLEWAMAFYGRETDQSLIPYLQALYQKVVQHTEPEHRRILIDRVSLTAEQYGLAPCTLLPALVVDDSTEVVSTATINYIALCHPDANGLPYEFEELDVLFRQRIFTSPGAAFGGLVASGDRRFHPQLHLWKQLLDEGAVRIASQTRSVFASHGQISFWLDWAEELVASNDTDSQMLLGRAAGAVAFWGRHNFRAEVGDVERRYPASSVAQTLVSHRTWGQEAYAREISAQLYRIEDLESPPKLFSDVIRAWGLPPKADLLDQFIPDPPR